MIQIILVLLCLLVLYYLANGAIFLPTDSKTVDRIIRLSQIQPGTRAVDLGSGDGRLVIALAQAGVSADGFEINPILVWWSRFKIRQAGLSGHAKIYAKSFWSQPLQDYDVIVVFGMTHIMARLGAKLKTEAKPGTLVVSNIFSFPDWIPIGEEQGIRIYKT